MESILTKLKTRKTKAKMTLLQERINFYQEKQITDDNYYLMCCSDNLAKISNAHYAHLDVKNFLKTYEVWDNKPPNIPLELGKMFEELMADDSIILGVQKFTNLPDKKSLEKIINEGLIFISNKQEKIDITYLNSIISTIISMKSDYQKFKGGILVSFSKNKDNFYVHDEMFYIKPECILGYYYYDEDKVKYVSTEEYLTENNASKREIKKD